MGDRDLAPVPSRMDGSLVAGLTELRSELRPTHTLPFFVFRKAMVPPPVTAVVSPLVSVLPVVPSVAEEMPVPSRLR